MLKGEVAKVGRNDWKSVDESGVSWRRSGDVESEGSEGVRRGGENAVEEGGRVRSVEEVERMEVERESEIVENGGFFGERGKEKESSQACDRECE